MDLSYHQLYAFIKEKVGLYSVVTLLKLDCVNFPASGLKKSILFHRRHKSLIDQTAT